MNERLLRHTVLSLGTAALLFSPSMVHAGFRWVPSDEVQSVGVVVAPPAPASETALPLIIDSPSAPSVGAEGDKNDTKPQALSADAEVKGFADQVPLSVAIRQVLPPGVGFSVSQDVSLGTLVSWRGGPSWRTVMKDMLLPAGLAMKEEGATVRVVRAMTLSDNGAGDTAKPMPLLPPVPAAGLSPIAPAGSAGPKLASASGYLMPPPGVVSSLAPSLRERVVPPSGGGDMWRASSGEMLKKVLEDWGRMAGVEVSWQAEYDYPIQASVSLSGSFESATRALLSGFQDAQPQPVGYLYNNQSVGQTVLVVQTRGNNYSE